VRRCVCVCVCLCGARAQREEVARESWFSRRLSHTLTITCFCHIHDMPLSHTSHASVTYIKCLHASGAVRHLHWHVLRQVTHTRTCHIYWHAPAHVIYTRRCPNGTYTRTCHMQVSHTHARVTYTGTCHKHMHVSHTHAGRTTPSMRGSPLAPSTRSRRRGCDDMLSIMNMGLGVNSRTMCSVAALSVSASVVFS
jgi:hypothetical protein